MERSEGEFFAMLWTIGCALAAVIWTTPSLLLDGYLEPWGVIACLATLVSATVWRVRRRMRLAYRPRPTHDDLD